MARQRPNTSAPPESPESPAAVMRTSEEPEGFDGEASNTSMISGANSPYQPTTEPVHAMNIWGGIRCDVEYLKSYFGIFKLVEVVSFEHVLLPCVEMRRLHEVSETHYRSAAAV